MINVIFLDTAEENLTVCGSTITAFVVGGHVPDVCHQGPLQIPVALVDEVAALAAPAPSAAAPSLLECGRQGHILGVE